MKNVLGAIVAVPLLAAAYWLGRHHSPAPPLGRYQIEVASGSPPVAYRLDTATGQLIAYTFRSGGAPWRVEMSDPYEFVARPVNPFDKFDPEKFSEPVPPATK